ncbi:MAG: glycoside hydrolase family 9 protein [Candidatus Acidiferrales bacterium]
MRLVFLLHLILFSAAAAFAAETATVKIKVDQVGYLPDAPKLAMVSAPAKTFQVKQASDGAVVLEGKLGAVVADQDSGDRVQTADFSSLRKPGKYYLEIPGIGRSWNFSISPDVFSRTYYLAMRAFYGQRCGMAVDLGPEFPGYSYPACHAHGRFHPSSGKQGPRDNVGGWHDAGDYGRYMVNSGITTASLLWTWDLYGSKVGSVKLNIPESGNGTPDILNEVRWNLEWMLKMQDDDGGVWQKQTSTGFPGFVMPQDDPFPSEVIGTGKPPYKSTCATADLAAVGAIAARIYAPFDKDFAARTLRAARQAWAWAERYPDVTFKNPPGVVTGEYADANCSDERLWAAAELWRTTGEDLFNNYFLKNYPAYRHTLLVLEPGTWRDLAPVAMWSYALGARKGSDAAAIEDIRKSTLTGARQIVERTRGNPYRVSLATNDYVWGSNGRVAEYGVQMLVANALSPDPAFVETALDDLHYLLGRNTFSMSWVTQVGSNPCRHIHHRPSGADKNPEPWPGLLAGGPNAERQDPMLRALPPQPPAKDYRDLQDSWASNEIAINWQAMLVFLLAGVSP